MTLSLDVTAQAAAIRQAVADGKQVYTYTIDCDPLPVPGQFVVVVELL